MLRIEVWSWAAHWMIWTTCAFALGWTSTGLAADDAAEKPSRPLTLEVELIRGREVSRLRVYLRNHTDRDIAFETGARGGPGSLNDQVLERAAGERPAIVIGSSPTVLPVLYFGYVDAKIALAPPTISGPTQRAMRPSRMTIPAGQRVMYANFAVPSAHVAGPFEQCLLVLRGEQDAPEPDVIGRWEMTLTTSELREVKAK